MKKSLNDIAPRTIFIITVGSFLATAPLAVWAMSILNETLTNALGH